MASENVPLGALHVALVALPPILPAKVTVPPAHTLWAVPALAVAAGLIIKVVAVRQLGAEEHAA